MKRFNIFSLLILALVSGVACAQSSMMGEVVPGTYAPVQVSANGVLRNTTASSLDWYYAAPTGGIIATGDNIATNSAGSGIRNYVTACQFQNGSASVATEVVIKDGGAVTMWRGYLAANQIAIIYFPSPLKGTANVPIVVAVNTAGIFYASCQGYKAP